MKPLVLLLMVLAFCFQCTKADSPTSAEKATATTGSVPAVQVPEKTDPAGTTAPNAQKAYVDPQTGELISKPMQDTPAANDTLKPSALDTSTEELQEQVSTVPGGGVMIDLKGKFRNPLKATINQNGDTSFEHQDTDTME